VHRSSTRIGRSYATITLHVADWKTVMIWRLAFIQLFFTLGWKVYVFFLPGLLKQAGYWVPAC